MPDWIVHLGATHAAARPLRRLDVRWLLLGAVLPDVVPRGLGMLIARVPALAPLGTLEVGLWLGFLHTPFSVALLIVGLVLLARDRRGAAWALSIGAAAHMLLDVMQRSFGGGTSLGYPVVLEPISLQVVWYESRTTWIVVGLSAAYLVFLRLTTVAPRDLPFRRPSPLALLGALLAGVAFLASPLLRIDRAIADNVAGAQLALDPERFVGQEVELPVVQVLRIESDAVIVDKSDAEMRVLWRDPSLEPGDFVSVRGVLTPTGVRPSAVFVHAYGAKSALSLVGLALLVSFWWPSLRPAWGRRRAVAAVDPSGAADAG